MSGSGIKPLMMGEFQAQFLQPFFCNYSLPQTQGGTAVSNLVNARLSRGMPTDVLTLDPRATVPVQCFRSDMVNLWVVQRRARKCIRDGYRQERELIVRALAESDADVCHAHWTYEYGLSAVSQNIKPSVVTVRDHSLNILRWVGAPYLGQYLITQYVLRKAAGNLTAVSPYISEYVSRIIGKDVPTIPNVVPSLNVQANSHRKGEVADCKVSSPVTIVTTADSGRLKNVKRAIRAFQIFRAAREDCRYVLIGVGLGGYDPLARWARSKGLSDFVEFKGWMSHKDVLRHVEEAAVVFHPSLEESFGNPVAEAMVLGVPVIGSLEAGGVRWLLDGGCGWLVNGRSLHELAAALAEVVDRVDQRRIARAHSRISRLCSADRILEEYENVYRSVVSCCKASLGSSKSRF